MRIDSHHHFWMYDADDYPWIGPEMKVLARDYLADDLAPLLRDNGLDGVVSVQARQSLAETRWLLDVAGQVDIVRGVVGWVPLMQDDIATVLDRLADEPYLKGVRHVVQDEPDEQFILGAEFNRGVSLLRSYGLIYDILIYARHLPPTIEFVDRHPEQLFVLDHIAKPTITTARMDLEWERHFRELARRPHVVCKFSGVVTEFTDPDWTAARLRPYWDVAWDAFGDDRLMYGSDWPVCLLRSSYNGWVNAVETLTADLTAAQRDNFFGQVASRVYQL